MAYFKLSVAGAVVLFLIVAVWYVHTSLWFVWHVLPADVLVRAAISSRDLRAIKVGGDTASYVPPPVAPYIFEAAKIGWAQDDAETTLVLIPRLSTHRSLPQSLQAAGWTVERRGIALVAKQRAGTPPTTQDIHNAFNKTLRQFIEPRWPIHPVALLQVNPGGMPGITEPMQLVATRHQSSLRILLLGNGETISGRIVTLPALEPTSARIFLPGSTWRTSALLQQAWNDYLIERYKFAATTPNLIDALSKFESGGIQINASAAGAGEVVIGVRGNAPAFTTVATTWVQEEERRQRLVTRAFRLPDGTLGYERVPGSTQAVFAAQDSDGCSAPLENRIQLWLCQQENVAALATSKAAALQFVAAYPAGAQVALGEAALTQFLANQGCNNQVPSIGSSETAQAPTLWCAIKSGVLTGDSTRLLLQLTLR